MQTIKTTLSRGLCVNSENYGKEDARRDSVTLDITPVGEDSDAQGNDYSRHVVGGGGEGKVTQVTNYTGETSSKENA